MFSCSTPPRCMSFVVLVNPFEKVSAVSNDPEAVDARFILPFESTEKTGIMVEEPYVPETTVVFASVKEPVEESVASPPKVTNAGTEDELTTSSCPPVPAVAVSGPVPAPRITPLAVKVAAPVPP